jgi:hypothetical protein
MPASEPGSGRLVVLDEVVRPDRPSSNSTSEILYIACLGRSGSTILDTVLGQVDELVSVGELKYIWERGFVGGTLCGCGQPLPNCNFWGEVMKVVGHPASHGSSIAALDKASKRFRSRHLPLLLESRVAEWYVSRVTDYQRHLQALYSAILEVSGAHMVIDSSKQPAYLALLIRTPGLRVRTLHLVRDPRAVAHSWQRRRTNPENPKGGNMPRFHPFVTGSYWTTWNLSIEHIGPQSDAYMRVRYEDLVRSPRQTFSNILDFAGISSAKLPFVDLTTVMLGPNHTVSGNPIRFNSGATAIQSDQAWESEMSPWDKLWVGLPTSPIRRRYGY